MNSPTKYEIAVAKRYATFMLHRHALAWGTALGWANAAKRGVVRLSLRQATARFRREA